MEGENTPSDEEEVKLTVPVGVMDEGPKAPVTVAVQVVRVSPFPGTDAGEQLTKVSVSCITVSVEKVAVLGSSLESPP